MRGEHNDKHNDMEHNDKHNDMEAKVKSELDGICAFMTNSNTHTELFNDSCGKIGKTGRAFTWAARRSESDKSDKNNDKGPDKDTGAGKKRKM